MENDKIQKLVDDKMKALKKALGTREVTSDDINLLNSLMQINKTLKDEKGVENMYEYSARRRDNRGRYTRSKSRYGARMPEIIGRMQDGYDDYDDWNNEYLNGSYGAKERMHEPLEYMMQSVVDFVETLANDNDDDREALDIIKRYVRKIKEI